MLTLKAGQTLELEKLIVWLSEHGYNRLDQVEVPGDFAVRGGIIDIYLPGDFAESGDIVGLTARIDFFDDTIESIKKVRPRHPRLPNQTRFRLCARHQGQNPRHLRQHAALQLFAAGHGCRLLGSAGDCGAGPELSRSAAGGEGDLPAGRDASECRSNLRVAGAEPVRPGRTAMPTLYRPATRPAFQGCRIRSLQRFETEAKNGDQRIGFELAQTHNVTVIASATTPAKRKQLRRTARRRRPGTHEEEDRASDRVSASGVCVGGSELVGSWQLVQLAVKTREPFPPLHCQPPTASCQLPSSVITKSSIATSSSAAGKK